MKNYDPRKRLKVQQPRMSTLQDVAKELGDCLWYIAVLAHDLGQDLDKIAADNLAKLKSRQERGVLAGSGDVR